MKRMVTCLTVSLVLPFAAQAQTAPATKTTAPATASSATPAAASPVDGDTTIEAAMATPAGKAAMEKVFPEIPNHAAYEQFKGMSLRQLQPLAGGIITDEKITAFEAAAKTK